MNSDQLERVSQQFASFFNRPILIGGMAAIQSGFTTEATNDFDVILVSSGQSDVARVLEDFSLQPKSGGIKGRGTYQGVHVDVYFAYRSKLGDRALLAVENLAEYVGQTYGNWVLLTPPAQFVTKLAALLDRSASDKGNRDARTLISMINQGVDGSAAYSVMASCSEADDIDHLWRQSMDELVDRAVSRDSQKIRKFFLA